MIDTHCHINDKLYRNNPEQYIKDAKGEGVEKFLIVGYDLESSILAVEMANKFSECYAAVGIHPSEKKDLSDETLCKIESLAKDKKVIAIGEIGLDFYWDKDENIRENQRIFFIKQIELANKLDLPISIHCREANEQCLNILKEHPVRRGGIMHCYAGSAEMMNDFIKLGFVLGIGGVVTFKNASRLKEVAEKVSSDSYVLETDAPYLTPAPYRGKENHSKYLKYVRDQIALLRKTTPEKVEEETNKNFKRVFKL